MNIISSLLLVPFFFLWMFLIVWIVKPKYFPFFKQNAIPSRWTVLGITAVIYIILSMLLVLTLANYDGASVTDFELIVMLFSILLLILLGFWSKYIANKRYQIYNLQHEPCHLISSSQVADSSISSHQKHQLILKIAQLIADLHQRGQYHGDINPNTILMDDYSASDMNAEHSDANVLLTNLTLAEPTSLSADQVSMSSNNNKNLLVANANPAYQAPERWQGQQATEQSDIYAFGVLLYEILTGKLPFAIAEQSSDPMLDWNNQHCLTPIPKLAEEYQPYQMIIDSALAKQRKKRYQSMQQAITDLQSLESR